MFVKKTFTILILIGCLFLLNKFQNQPRFSAEEVREIGKDMKFKVEKITQWNDRKKYEQGCLKLFKKLRHPDKNLIIYPPVKEIPQDMYLAFTQNGELPVKRYWYFNEAYPDSSSDNKNETNEVLSDKLDQFIEKVRKDEPLGYEDKILNKMMHEYSETIKGKSLVVIGTQTPWVEAIAYDVGASKITTLDYTRKKYARPGLEWIHVNDYLDEAIKKKNFENYDNSASFSSIEHSGLGRYGDPLSPNGDIEALQQIHCMLKPGGLLFLAIPASPDGKGYIEFNAHRVYGDSRLKLLFEGWDLIEKRLESVGYQTIFVLKKHSTYA